MKKEILIGVIVLALFLVGCTKSADIKSALPAFSEEPQESVVEQLPEQVEVEQVVEEVETVGVTHTIKFVGKNFEPENLTVKVGDTVVWQNDRNVTSLNKAMVVGTQKCSYLKSPILESGETFEWTFTEPGTCKIVDGYLTSNFGKVIVEE